MVNFGCPRYVLNYCNVKHFGKKVECRYYQLTHKSKKEKPTVNRTRTLHSPCNYKLDMKVWCHKDEKSSNQPGFEKQRQN